MSAATASSIGPVGNGAEAQRPLQLARHPLWLALALTVITTALRLSDTVDPDVSWQLWIAHQIHAGANLYTDIVEVNPPLWFWMALPIDRMAALLHLRSETVLTISLGSACFLAIAATGPFLEHVPRRRRTLLLGYSALTLMGMPWMHAGQREQIVLIATLPYAALLSARREGRPVRGAHACLIGAGFALGIALKHYFLVVPVLLEIWLMTGNWRAWRPIRPETVTIVSVGAAYAAAVIVLEPDFIGTTLPLIRLAYGSTGAPSLRFLFGPYALTALGMLALILGRARLLSKAPLSSALLACGIAFALAYFVQSKGWPYHAIPMLGCGSLALAALIAETKTPPQLLRVISPALLSFPLLLAAEDRAHPTLPSPDLIDAVDGIQRGETVGFLAVEPAIPWSITWQRGFRYPSRYMGYWMLRAVNERSAGSDPRLSALGRQVVSETVSDFLCAPPKRLIIPGPRWGGGNFDILSFFRRDAAFAAVFSHYRLRKSTSLDSYDLAFPLPPSNKPCRRGA